MRQEALQDCEEGRSSIFELIFRIHDDFGLPTPGLEIWQKEKPNGNPYSCYNRATHTIHIHKNFQTTSTVLHEVTHSLLWKMKQSMKHDADFQCLFEQLKSTH